MYNAFSPIAELVENIDEAEYESPTRGLFRFRSAGKEVSAIYLAPSHAKASLGLGDAMCETLRAAFHSVVKCLPFPPLAAVCPMFESSPEKGEKSN
jgi:hypothetical protein